MKIEIPLSGQCTVPSDYTVKDGKTAVSLNLICEDHELHVIRQPLLIASAEELTDGSGTAWQLCFVHRTSDYTNYILYDSEGNSLAWNTSLSADGLKDLMDLGDAQLLGIQQVGNTLAIITSGGTLYALYKDGGYVLLGDFPELPVSFGLQAQSVMSSMCRYEVKKKKKVNGYFNITGWKPSDALDSIDDSGQYTFSEDEKASVTSAVLAKVNRFIAEEVTGKGRFIYPFFVRCAYRLFDGTLTMHSAPVLMVPSTGATPLVFTQGKGEKGTQGDIFAMPCSLDYMALDSDALAEIKGKWSDIITSLDVFISAPLYTYDQSGECETAVLWQKNGGEIQASAPSDNLMLAKIPCGNDESEEAELTGYPFRNHHLYWHKCGNIPAQDPAFEDTIPEIESGMETYHQWWDYEQLATFFRQAAYWKANGERPEQDAWWRIPLPEFSKAEMADKIEQNATFFLLESIKPEDIKTKRTLIDIGDEYLQSLVNREQMSDDYQSHEHRTAKGGYVYNSRLSLYGIQRELFGGFQLQAMLPCQSGYKSHWITEYVNGETGYDYKDTFFYDHEALTLLSQQSYTVSDGAGSTVKAGHEDTDTSFLFLPHRPTGITDNYGSVIADAHCQSLPYYFFYPSAECKELFLQWIMQYFDCDAQADNTVWSEKAFAMTEHDSLNGAYAFTGWPAMDSKSPYRRYSAYYYKTNANEYGSLAEMETEFEETLDVDEPAVINAPSKVYTSEAYNPFQFLLTGVNTIGSGEVTGLCAATKAMSQGQFGQYPVYAFTTEGVWALDVSSATGGFSSAAPVSLDICTNANTITQLDGSVLFMTAKGLMEATGSSVRCISDSLDFYPYDLTRMQRYSEYIKNGYGKSCPLIGVTMPLFTEYADTSSTNIIYDYGGRQVIIHNPGYGFAFVLSLKSTEWGMMSLNATSSVSSYPNSYINTPDGVCDVSARSFDDVPALAVTRALKLDRANLFKLVRSMILRGYSIDDEKGSSYCNCAVWGSNDFRTWCLVRSTKDIYNRGYTGNPYKFYRFALASPSLQYDTCIAEIGCEYEPQDDNKLR